MTQEFNDESWIEEQCFREINNQHEEIERDYNRQRDGSLSTVWGSFQDSATSLAQLYRERSSANYTESGALWLPFQTAAGTVTKLYKESCDGIKRSSENAIHLGYHKRNKEIADWARSKKRRMIRREDLLAYLSGKPLPPLSSNNNYRRSPKPENNYPQSSHNTMLGLGSLNHSTNVAIPSLLNQPINTLCTDPANDLHTFKEALVLRPRGPELFAFVANEIARHCKRPASPVDDKMEDCQLSNKRQRLM